MEYYIGAIIDGEITGIQPYGAFVALNSTTQGLIHISEVRHGYIKNINEVLQIGMKVQVRVIDIDEYSHKISLSMRACEEHPHNFPMIHKHKRYFTNKYKRIGFQTLEEALPDWTHEALRILSKKKN